MEPNRFFDNFLVNFTGGKSIRRLQDRAWKLKILR